MAKNDNTPEIRFKGFTDPWEQRKLGELCEVNPTSVLPKSFEYVDLESVVGTDMVSHRRKEKIAAPSRAQRLASVGDIFYQTVRPYQKNNYFYELPDEDYVFSTGYAQLRPLCDGRFLFASLQREQFVSRVLEHCTGTSYPAINANDLAALSLAIPNNPEEQRLVGSILKPIDNLITLTSRKHEKLVQMKKAMLDKMFPKPGEKFPEIRFKGFTDPWEQRKLGELMDVTSVRRVRQEDWTDEGVRFLRARDLVAFAKNEAIDDPLFISDEMYREYSAQSGKVVVGDLLVTGVGTIGVPWLVTSENPVYFKDGNIIWFKNQNAVDGEFFYHSFTAHAIQRYIKEAAGIGTVGTYTIETGKKTPIWLPLEREQRQIAAFMTSLDSLITLTSRKLELLRNIKKAMLDKMFV